MKIKIFIKWTDFDKDGNIIGEEEHEHEANSLVKQFIAILMANMTGVSLTSQTDTGGTSRTITATATMVINALANNSNFGLVFGRGTNAVTITDYALQTPITHGVGTNQLQYGIVTFDSALTVGSTIYFQAYRTVTNNSGATITINEAGLVFYYSYYFLIDRTLTTKEILNTNGSTCTYKIELSL